MKVKDYMILSRQDKGSLSDIVVKMIKEGWQPIGGVAINDKLMYFYQAMAKYEYEGLPQGLGPR